MDDFLYVLKIQLMDRLMPKELDEQIALYENYINEEIAGGKTLEQVMRKLGDPAKVADMIVAHKRGEDFEASAEDVTEYCGCGLCSVCTEQGNYSAENCAGQAGCAEKNSAEKMCGAAGEDNAGNLSTKKSDAGNLSVDKNSGNAGETKSQAEKTAEEINAQIHNPEYGFHAEFKPDKGWDIRLGKLKLNSWYGTLIILGVVLAVFILFSEMMH